MAAAAANLAQLLAHLAALARRPSTSTAQAEPMAAKSASAGAAPSRTAGPRFSGRCGARRGSRPPGGTLAGRPSSNPRGVHR